MNMNLFSVVLCFIFAAFPALAGISPFALSMASGKNAQNDAQLPSASNTIMGMRIGIISGGHAGMHGIAVSSLYNEDETFYGDVTGIQTAGLFNTGRGGTYGAWQISGLVNKMTADANGMQVSSIYNESSGCYNGLMICGCVNHARDDVYGWQISGMGNAARMLHGVQLSTFNLSTSFVGVQLGVVNLSNAPTTSSSSFGFQLGVLNICRGRENSFWGVQLGLLNFLDKSDMPVLPLLRLNF